MQNEICDAALPTQFFSWIQGHNNDLETQHHEDQDTIEQLRRQLEKAKNAAKTATDNAEAENARDDQKIEDLQLCIANTSGSGKEELLLLVLHECQICIA